MSARNLTFKQLSLCMAERIGQPGMPNPSSLGNLTSALSAFIAERDLSPESTVGSVLRISFYRTVGEHVKALRAERRSADYVANRKSHMKQWRKLVTALDHEEAARSGVDTPLQKALKAMFAEGMSIKGTARQLGIHLASLRRWLNGTTPQRGSCRHLKKLEVFVGMAPGTLTDLLPYAPQEAATTSSANPIPYRKRLGKAASQPYALKPQRASEAFREEWSALLRFKTDVLASVLDTSDAKPRSGRGSNWRLTPLDAPRDDSNAWVDTIDAQGCVSAQRFFTLVSQFFGWLMLEEKQGGMGMSADKAHTMGQFTDRDLLKKYLDWRLMRAGGIMSGAWESVLTFVAMLCHPGHGFLVTRPDIGLRVGIAGSAWIGRCTDAKRYADAVKKRMQARKGKSRDPSEPIKDTLALENPLDAIADALRRHEARRPFTGGLAEAIWVRDHVLLRLSVSNPLRAQNLKSLTWRPDGSGQLRKDSLGRWRIVIEKQHFKNEQGAARERAYDQIVHESVWPMLETYLKDYRPMLDSENDRVFVSSDTSSRGKVWRALNHRFATLTRRYLHGCPGSGPHCIRHIVATAIVKKTGNFVAAALVLHDREETVRKNYGHLCSDDGARWHAAVIGDAFKKK